MNKLISMLIYIILYTFTIILFKFAIKNNIKKYKIKLFLVALLPSLFAGLRYETGRDYFSYVKNFELIGAGLNSRLEIGFQQINKLVYFLGLTAQHMFFITSLIMMLFICFGLYRKKINLPIVWGIFTFLMLFYQSSFNVVRLMLAVSIVFYNVKNIEERNFLKFLMYICLASTIHLTAMVMLPMYFIYNNVQNQKNSKKKFLLYLMVIFITLNINQIIQIYINTFENGAFDYYSKYANGSGAVSAEALQQTLFYFPLIIFGLLKYKKSVQLDNKFHIYYSLTVVGTLILIVSIFLENYIYRLADYFLIFNILTIPTYIKCIKKDKEYLSFFILLSLIFMYWAIWYFIIGAHGTSIYKIIV